LSFKIKILPLNLETGFNPGENLGQILRQAGVQIEAACGGQGTCGRCVVKVVKGRCDLPDTRTPAAVALQKGEVLSCQATLFEDIVIEIPETRVNEGVDHALYHPDAPEVQVPEQLSPLSRRRLIHTGTIKDGKKPSDHEYFLSLLSMDDADDMDERCEFGLSALIELSRIRAQYSGTIAATIVEQDGPDRLIKLEPADTAGRELGIACDIGTTTIAVAMVDLATGRILDTVSAYNDQIQCGADVISRIIYARKKDRLAELNRRLVDTINRLLSSLMVQQSIAPDEVTAAVLSGNTTMTHLALGIDPRHIREEPYLPTVRNVPLLSARDMGLNIHPAAVVHFTPCVGSYVGGDITSGVLCARLRQGPTQCHTKGHEQDHRQDRTEGHTQGRTEDQIQGRTRGSGPDHTGVDLFIDIGTNGELVIMGEGWAAGCACSAGPAFEGVGIKCGMRAAEGAIEAFSFLNGGSRIEYQVIGNGKPLGICGSGLIDLVASLFKNGVIGRDGKFTQETSSGRVRKAGNQRVFVVADDDETATGKPIHISEQDISNIMRAKAAIYSACSLLIRNVGLKENDIEKIHIAGGFGSFLDIGKSVAIGLFPDLDRDRFEYLGNTSIRGAYYALVSAVHRESLKEIARAMTYIDLSSEPQYMDEYTGALFLPHTDEKRFPSSIKRTMAG